SLRRRFLDRRLRAPVAPRRLTERRGPPVRRGRPLRAPGGSGRGAACIQGSETRNRTHVRPMTPRYYGSVMAAEELVIHGAREHNLKDITVRLPRNKLICITGLSGSGKSSLAFDTIYAEGQRRYVESLSAYARQFL